MPAGVAGAAGPAPSAAATRRGLRPQPPRRAEFAAAGKTLDMGKTCVRFKSLDDLAPDAIGRVIASTPVDAFIARYEASRKGR